ncbi:phage terminase small subunit [Clostridium sp. JS66]|uniref:phage terminase small subunit n=1 Tax=Clostridium sp. JS66 TaxID=3064705 RepID=UPI00298E8751|nr:phage terminase small subunit [Clostridium sp. JS66]WPC40633.1 phage terminase small subunit [Clostridium sp. JS66]
MPRQRSPNSIRAEQMYISGNGKMELVDIARKLKVPYGTIKSWKSRYRWNNKLNESLEKERMKIKCNTINEKYTKGAPRGNKNAEKHGFFSKIFPPETLDIVQDIIVKNPLDMLWENIIIQYTAIARSQKIMNVKNQEDLTKVLKKQKESNGDTSESWEKEYELQFAWDKQATFLQAQSRAMKTLESMIKQYDELLRSNLATEEQKLRIEKLKIDISNVNVGNNGSNKEGIKEFVKATTMNEDEVKELFKDDENEKEETE